MGIILVKYLFLFSEQHRFDLLGGRRVVRKTSNLFTSENFAVVDFGAGAE
jgi:hypothetical protein